MSPIILLQSKVSEVALPGYPVENWLSIAIIGIIVSAIIATVWILIPSISLPPKGKEEWKLMSLVWVVVLGSSLPIGAAVGFGSNVVPFIFKMSNAESAIEEYYDFASIEGLPHEENSDKEEVTVYLTDEDAEERDKWVNCLVSTGETHYLPLECETEEEGQFAVVTDPETFDYFVAEEDESFWG